MKSQEKGKEKLKIFAWLGPRTQPCLGVWVEKEQENKYRTQS